MALLPQAHAQVAAAIPPLSSRFALSEAVPVYRLPTLDNDSLDAVHNRPDESGYTGHTFGVVLPCDIDLARAGRWDTLASGDKVWRLKIYSEHARGFRISCDRFQLPPGASLHFYDTKGTRIYGAYTQHNNQPHGKFGTGVLPKGVADPGLFHLNKISYVFVDRDHIGDAAPCHNDVNCLPWVNEWCNEIRAVVKIAYRTEVSPGDIRDNWGSGVLVNNTNENFSPFILTAKHIADGGTSGTSVDHEIWTIYYNFQAPSCAENFTGNDMMRTMGVNVLTTNSGSSGPCPDLGLLESIEEIPLGYNIYFAGWNRNKRSNWPSDDIVTIHHPQADLKKVSEGRVVGTTAGQKCYEVKYDLGLGIVESGSSGAPSFDINHRIVAIQSQTGMDCEDDNVKVRQGNIAKAHESGINFDWYGYLGGGNTLNGIDPLGACQVDLVLHGNLYPGNDWQAKNEILVQAERSISTWPNPQPTLIQATPSYMFVSHSSDYTFRAGRSVTLLPGFKVENGNRFLAEIGDCESFDGCGFNFEAVPGGMAPAGPNVPAPVDPQDSTRPPPGFSIQPNPTGGQVSLRFPEAVQEVKCTLTTLWGKVVWTRRLRGTLAEIHLDFSDQRPGTYLLKVEIEGTSSQQKLVIRP
mgnify:CR=1 FL=1